MAKHAKLSKPPQTVTFDDVTVLRMVAGNEKRFTRVIHDGFVKEWVGMGWIALNRATAQDRRTYPTVVPAE